jgi:ribonucleotide reductase alpha subunit
MLCAVAVHVRSPYRFSKPCGHRADRCAAARQRHRRIAIPLSVLAENAHPSRRISLGITWLADFLVVLGLTYGSDRSISLGADIMRCICHSAYRASIALCKRKNKIPLFRTPQVFAEPLHPEPATRTSKTESPRRA